MIKQSRFWLFALWLFLIPLPLYYPLFTLHYEPYYDQFSSFSLYPNFAVAAVILLVGLTRLDRPTLFQPLSLSIPLGILCLLTALSMTYAAVDGRLSLIFLLRLLIALSLYIVLKTDWIGQEAIFYSLLVFLCVQGSVAAAQFYLQDDLGLVWLGEFDLAPEPGRGSIIFGADGYWLRGYGLAPHPNILGGMLGSALLIILFGGNGEMGLPGGGLLSRKVIGFEEPWFARLRGLPSRKVIGFEEPWFARLSSRGLLSRKIIGFEEPWFARLSRPLRRFALFIGTVGLLVSFSRSAWLGTAVGLAVGFGLKLLASLAEQKREPQLKTRLKIQAFIKSTIQQLIPLILAVIIFIPAAWGPLQARSQPQENQIVTQSVGERQLLTDLAYEFIDDNFWFGLGAGNFGPAMLDHPKRDDYPNIHPVHNVPLLLTAELGIAGGLTWLWLMLFPIGYGLYALLFANGRIHYWTIGLIAGLTVLAAVDLLDYYSWGWPHGLTWRWMLFALLAKDICEQ